jgi:hypothetical protein
MKRRLLQYLLAVATGAVVAATLVLGLAVGFGLELGARLGIPAAFIFVLAIIGLFLWHAREYWSWSFWHRRTGRWLARREALCSQGRCPECAYDLTGNVSGVCPECGNERC